MGERSPSQGFEKKGFLKSLGEKVALGAVVAAASLGGEKAAKADEQDLYDAGTKVEKVDRSSRSSHDQYAPKGQLSDEEAQEIRDRSAQVEKENDDARAAYKSYFDKNVSYEDALAKLEKAFPVRSNTTLNRATIKREANGDIFINGTKVTAENRLELFR